MDLFQDNDAPRRALTNFLINHGSEMSQELRDKILEASSSASVPDAVVHTGELLFARRAELPKDGKVLGAQFADYRRANGWHRDQDDTSTRAIAIRDAMMREAGLKSLTGGALPKKEDDPEPLDRWKAPAAGESEAA